MGLEGIDGTVAVVTGAGGGIGRAVVAALAAEGARVAAVDRDPHGLAGTVEQTRAFGGDVAPHTVDVRDEAAVEDLFDAVETDLGPVAHAVNVAGILRTGPVTDLSGADWADLFAVNTTGVFHVCRAAARRMIARAAGSIITVASNAAGIPRADMAAYGASKAAAALFTKSLGLELGPHGIRCNVVSPGSTDTPMQRGMWQGPHDAEKVIAGDPAKFRAGIPLGRIAQPADVAAAVRFLSSAQARQITMHDLYVDGGATQRA